MKKSLLLSLVVLISLVSFSQSSCPVISNFVVAPQGPGMYKVSFHHHNPTSGNKNILVSITCNGVNVAGYPFCRDAKNDGDYSSAVFPCSSLSTLVVTLTPFTGNDCGGAACGPSQRSIGGAPLPVKFKSFTATRDHSSVMLKWETASEMNNSGFAIERNDNGTWQEIAWANSQAIDGISDAVLTYTYIDMNTSKGISQYRIRQVDIDSKSKYSDIRSVRGDGQVGKAIIFPNPTNDGKVNIVFDDANVNRSVSVIDMSGRIVKQLRDVTTNNITIADLKPGMYTLRVLVPATGEQAVQKIIVIRQ